VVKKELKSEQFFRLYNAAHRRIYSYLLIMVHNHNDAEDLLQETASILWEKFDDFDKNASFAAWAIGIARNKALDFIRSKRSSRPFMDDEFYNQVAEMVQSDITAADQRLKALSDCIKKMSLQNQKLIHLRFEKGFTVKKISQISEHSADAIYKKISRIYAALHTCVSRTLLQGEHI
jgi:RNA polymerase sigma-70 factor, ECF subfamily